VDGSVRWLAKLLINTDVDPRSNEMTVRTGSKTVTFHRPFHLKDVGRMLPPGDYRVVTDEEVIEGLSFTAYHRISTEIFVPAEAGCAVEMMTIDPMDLQAVHEQDVAMLAVYSVWEGRRSLRPD